MKSDKLGNERALSILVFFDAERDQQLCIEPGIDVAPCDNEGGSRLVNGRLPLWCDHSGYHHWK